jgi:hypothetical protein
MRVSLGGWGFELEGMSAFDEPDPNTDVISLFLEDGVPFEKGPYLDLNYTRYEVWCVGAAGGRGGSILRSFDPLNRKSIWGGAGGGGGLHRVGGMLAALPASVDVTIGAAGADGQNGSGEIWDWDSDPEHLPYPMLPDRDGSGNIISPLHLHPNPELGRTTSWWRWRGFVLWHYLQSLWRNWRSSCFANPRWSMERLVPQSQRSTTRLWRRWRNWQQTCRWWWRIRWPSCGSTICVCSNSCGRR